MDQLTPRENEVIEHLKLGKPNKIIAFEMHLSEATIKIYLSNIIRKTGLQNRTAIAIKLLTDDRDAWKARALRAEGNDSRNKLHQILGDQRIGISLKNTV
jgi:DNA-binding CsgD family transcriptional regulator